MFRDFFIDFTYFAIVLLLVASFSSCVLSFWMEICDCQANIFIFSLRHMPSVTFNNTWFSCTAQWIVCCSAEKNLHGFIEETSVYFECAVVCILFCVTLSFEKNSNNHNIWTHLCVACPLLRTYSRIFFKKNSYIMDTYRRAGKDTCRRTGRHFIMDTCRRTGRHFTEEGGKLCPENNNLP